MNISQVNSVNYRNQAPQNVQNLPSFKAVIPVEVVINSRVSTDIKLKDKVLEELQRALFKHSKRTQLEEFLQKIFKQKVNDFHPSQSQEIDQAIRHYTGRGNFLSSIFTGNQAEELHELGKNMGRAKGAKTKLNSAYKIIMTDVEKSQKDLSIDVEYIRDAIRQGLANENDAEKAVQAIKERQIKLEALSHKKERIEQRYQAALQSANVEIGHHTTIYHSTVDEFRKAHNLHISESREAQDKPTPLKMVVNAVITSVRGSKGKPKRQIEIKGISFEDLKTASQRSQHQNKQSVSTHNNIQIAPTGDAQTSFPFVSNA